MIRRLKGYPNEIDDSMLCAGLDKGGVVLMLAKVTVVVHWSASNTVSGSSKEPPAGVTILLLL